jgi:hypothetical protein
MAKPGFLGHWKFLDLCGALQMPPAHVLGHCEMMWIAAAHSGPSFRDFRHLEGASGWKGEPGELAKALLVAQLIDQTPEGALSVHDFDDHKPRYLIERERQRENRHSVANSCQQLPTVAIFGDNTPPSLPSPSLPKEKKLLSDQSDVMEGFLAFWEAYRHKVGRKAAEKAWKSSAKMRPALDSLLKTVRTYRESPLGSSAPAHPATWLNGARWQDDPGALTVPRNGREEPPAPPSPPYYRDMRQVWAMEAELERRMAEEAEQHEH